MPAIFFVSPLRQGPDARHGSELGHIGGGLKLYAWGNVFIRPEAHLYLVHNNIEFAGPRANSVGVSIGYTFRPSD